MLPSLIDMLRQLVAIPSVSCTDPRLDQGNEAVVRLLADWLTELGFACELMPIAPGKANLIATFGSGPGGLVLAGHTDTVPYDTTRWQSDPFTLSERDGKLYGLGTADMKGFFPLAIEAARSLLAEPFQAPLIILATCDEESSMSGARALVAAGKPRARHALIGEPTGLKPIRMHKGILMEAIRIQGRSGHSSDPALGANALEAMNAAMNRLLGLRTTWQRRYTNAQFAVPVPTLNLGCIHGGDNPNRICPSCELQFDLRLLPGMEAEQLRAEIRRELVPVAEEFGVGTELVSLYPGTPAVETPADAAIVQLAERLTGHTAGSVAFGTEAPYLRQLGMDTLILGPGRIDQAHQPDEYLELASLQPTIDLLQGFIRAFCLNS